MKTYIYIVSLVISLSLLGCPVRSIYPLFTENDITFNPGVVGAWVDKEQDQTYLFQKGKGKNYTVILMDKRDTVQYKVQLGQIGKFWFLDSYPMKDPEDYHAISTHIFSKMWLLGDTLKYAPLESDSLKKLIETGNLKVSVALLEDDFILTASTKELQQVILKVANDDVFFQKPKLLVRMK